MTHVGQSHGGAEAKTDCFSWPARQSDDDLRFVTGHVRKNGLP